MGHIGSKAEVRIEGVLMPSYYIDDAKITEEDIVAARKSWTAIQDNTAGAFVENSSNNDFEYGSALAWFYESFYQRLFEVYPSCRPLFKGDLQVQGRALVKMVGVALDNLTVGEVLVPTLQKLARSHAARGVVTREYFIVGEVLIHTLQKVLGPTQFDKPTTTAWLKIYSIMLLHIIPVAVVEEKKFRSDIMRSSA